MDPLRRLLLSDCGRALCVDRDAIQDDSSDENCFSLHAYLLVLGLIYLEGDTRGEESEVDSC